MYSEGGKGNQYANACPEQIQVVILYIPGLLVKLQHIALYGLQFEKLCFAF